MLSIPGQPRFLLQHNRTRNSSKFSAFEARFCAQRVCGGRETLDNLESGASLVRVKC